MVKTQVVAPPVVIKQCDQTKGIIESMNSFVGVIYNLDAHACQRPRIQRIGLKSDREAGFNEKHVFHKAPISRFSSCRDPSSGDAKAREKSVHNDFVLEVWTLSNWNQRWSISDNGCEKAQLQGRNYTDQKGDMDLFLPSFLLSIHPSYLVIHSQTC